MSDVIHTIVSTDIKNGTIMVLDDQFGDYATIDTYIESNPLPSGAIIAKYDDRFDDPRYYSGDLAS